MNKSELIRKVESKFLKEKVPAFSVGDTVNVSVRIVEGEGKDAKERLQVFSGVVIARRGSGINSSFIVRRIVNNEGVERVFMLHSPKIADVAVTRSGKTRRAKLFYLRDRVGKAVRLRELKNAEKYDTTGTAEAGKAEAPKVEAPKSDAPAAV
jgi:large subunit ribosomal protein L19